MERSQIRRTQQRRSYRKSTSYSAWNYVTWHLITFQIKSSFSKIVTFGTGKLPAKILVNQAIRTNAIKMNHRNEFTYLKESPK